MSVSNSTWAGVLCLVSAGCGGIDANGLLDREPPVDGADAGLAVADAGAPPGTDGIDATSGAIPPPDATVADATPALDSGGGFSGNVDSGGTQYVDATPVLDATPPPPHDAGKGPVDAGPTPPPTGDGTRCGTTAQGVQLMCALPNVCCVTNGAAAGLLYFQCTYNNGTCPGLTLPCDDHNDCPKGTMCCGQTGANGQYSSMQCQTSCNPAQAQYEMCDPFEQPSECPSGTTCQASGVLPGYYRCAP